MGQEISYCGRCQNRIVGGEFDRAEAYRVGEQSVCATCAMQMLPTLPLAEQEQILAQKRKAADAKERKSAPPSPKGPLASHTPLRGSPAAGGPARLPMGVLVGIGVTLVVLVGMLVVSSGSPPPPVAPAPVVKPPPLPAAGPSPREVAGQTAFQFAVSFAKDHPADLDEQAKLFEKIAADYDNTPACADAKRELERIARKRKEAAGAELTALLARTRELTVGQEFGKAIEVLEGARKSHREPEWVQPIEGKLKEIENTMDAEFPALRDQAVAARKKDATGELELLRSKVAKWNVPQYAAALDKALGTAFPPITAKPDRILLLRVAEATIIGSKLKKAGEGDWSFLQSWGIAKEYVEWDVLPAQAGAYTLKLNYTSPREFRGTPFGGEFSVTVGQETKTFSVEPTKTWGDFTTFTFGTMNLPAGPCKVTVRPVKIINGLMSLRFVQFVPVK